MKVDKQQLMNDHKEMNLFRSILNPDTYANPQEIITIYVTEGDNDRPVTTLRPTVAGLINLIMGSMHQLEKHTPKKES